MAPLETGPGTAGRPAAPTSAQASQEAVDRAVGRLRAVGQRVTPARVAVLAVLAGRNEHRSADDVAAEVEQVAPKVHRATVYRTLETLSAVGLVTHVHMGHGSTAYHLAGELSGQAHLHARCSRCERVVDLPPDLLDDARRRLTDELGFALDPAHVALSGRCAECSGRAAAPPASPAAGS